MKILLDTHAFLWWVTADKQLSKRAAEIMQDHNNELYLSAASGMEIAIKANLRKLDILDTEEPVPQFIAQQLRQNTIQTLPILMSHALYVYTLPNHHRDPFDRLLVAQSQLESLPILTIDAKIKQYDVEVIW